MKSNENLENAIKALDMVKSRLEYEMSISNRLIPVSTEEEVSIWKAVALDGTGQLGLLSTDTCLGFLDAIVRAEAMYGPCALEYIGDLKL